MYPSLNQFLHWSKSHRAIPIWLEPELPAENLTDWLHNLLGSTQKFFFLHSAAPGPNARYSYFSLEPPRYTLDSSEGSLMVRYHADSGTPHDALKIGNPFDRLSGWLAHWSGPRLDGLPPFWGGLVGYFGYETARYLEPGLKHAFEKGRKPDALSTQGFHDFEFGLFDMVAAVDHARRRLWLVHTVLLPERKKWSPAQLERIYRSGQDVLRRQAVRLQRALRQNRSWGSFQASEVRSNQSEAAYRMMVRRAKSHIAAGDIYQANLSQSLTADWDGDPWTLYRQLTDINPSPYAALWRSGTRWMASASPELLLRLEDGRLETRPIAGTYPRTRGAGDEERQTRALTTDLKERAEHLMLVDLERNDLGRVCRPQSIHVAEAFTVEAYSHVYHIVSDIRGAMAEGKTWKDAVRACFPGGTITGCPKIRCMELIQKLEPQPRGPYCGSLGWIGFNGDMTLNILIRTFFLDQGRAAAGEPRRALPGRLRFPVGAGIVADSDPLREYQETWHKARALLLALQAAGLPAARTILPRREL